MPWGRYDDKIRGNPKLRAVGKPVRGGLMMIWGYCAEQRSDGWVPRDVVEAELTPAELRRALTVKANGRAALLHAYDGEPCDCLQGLSWSQEMAGFWVHDWLEHNPSKAENTVHRAKGRELKDADLRYAAKMRDGNACRYCGVVRPWNDNRSRLALEIDHVNPTIAAGVGNLVVACKSCNSAKKDALTPEAAGLTMLPPPVQPPGPDGWAKDTDPGSIARAWPPECWDIETADGSWVESPDRPPIASPIRPPDRPAVDRAVDRAVDPVQNGGHTAGGPSDVTAVPLAPGRGRDGSGGRSPPDLGPAAGARKGHPAPVVGPATTPRSASNPPTYRKSATSNPNPPKAS